MYECTSLFRGRISLSSRAQAKSVILRENNVALVALAIFLPRKIGGRVCTPLLRALYSLERKVRETTGRYSSRDRRKGKKEIIFHLRARHSRGAPLPRGQSRSTQRARVNAIFRDAINFLTCPSYSCM